MPEAEIARRGGAVRVRTQRLKDGYYRHVFIVRDAGAHGGHTVVGEKRKTKGDDQPEYKVRPDTRSLKRAVRK